MFSRIILCFVLGVFLFTPIYAQEGIEKTLQAIIADTLEPYGTAAVLQIKTLESEWIITSGSEDITTDVPTRRQDRFRIGSISKTFLAVTTLRLVEQRILSLDEKADRWLSDDLIANLANVEQVTLRQLLSMRSGVPEYLNAIFIAAVKENLSRIWTAEDALVFAYNLPALFEPDAQFSYSNSNYLLMQLVLESATGKPLHVLLREYILDPLELTNTYTQIAETQDEEFVHGYSTYFGGNDFTDVTAVNDGAGLGDGALISNAEDVTSFFRALLLDQTLLTESSMRDLLAFQLTDDESQRYGLGITEWETPWRWAIGHAGGVVGFQSLALLFVEQQVSLVALIANDAPIIDNDFIATLLDPIMTPSS